MTVVVEAIIAGLCLCVCAHEGTGWEANCRLLQLTVPVDTGAKRLLRSDEKFGGAVTLMGGGAERCGWKICLGACGAVEAKAFEALPMVPLLH